MDSDIARLRFVRILSHLVFIAAAAAFAWVFYHPDTDHPLALLLHCGIAVNLWSALQAAFSFTTTCGHKVKPWLRGANLTSMAAIMFFCILAMAAKEHPCRHILFVHIALSLYIIWDILAIKYYKSVSVFLYERYVLLFWADLSLVVVFFAGYIPFLYAAGFKKGATIMTPDTAHMFANIFVFTVLIAELLVYLYAEFLFRLSKSDILLSPEQGYRLWAPNYKSGNAIIHVERRHTLSVLDSLSLDGSILDFGCGDGYYAQSIARPANRIMAIDQCSQMLENARAICSGFNIDFSLGSVDRLRGIPDGSFDGVFAALVIDHLRDGELELFVSECGRILRSGGWIYLSDVNAYYEQSIHPYARFVDAKGYVRKIVVYPHSISSVLGALSRSGFPSIDLTEVPVTEEDLCAWPDLRDEISVGFSLISSYLGVKP
ncbi:MAG: methyltransferase domain-containing protein [Verrucomicrobiae bacterium]|nr:methyltransferase domain-containing protein [Verrucomicrobiae bacterium]